MRLMLLVVVFLMGCQRNPPLAASPTTTPSSTQVFATLAGPLELAPPPGFVPNHGQDGPGWQLAGPNGTSEAWIRVRVKKLPANSREPLSPALVQNPNLTVVAQGQADVGSAGGSGLMVEQTGQSPGGLLGPGTARYLNVLYQENGIRYHFTLTALASNIDKHRETFFQLLRSFRKP